MLFTSFVSAHLAFALAVLKSSELILDRDCWLEDQAGDTRRGQHGPVKCDQCRFLVAVSIQLGSQGGGYHSCDPSSSTVVNVDNQKFPSDFNVFIGLPAIGLRLTTNEQKKS